MAKEWILNSAMNRYQLNFKRNVGATSESIRKCSPKTLEEWRFYYFNNVKPETHIEELGKKLYVKITEVIQSEVADVTEQDCIDYMKQLVIERTFDGYMTEIQTIYGQLQSLLELEVKPALMNGTDFLMWISTLKSMKNISDYKLNLSIMFFNYLKFTKNMHYKQKRT